MNRAFFRRTTGRLACACVALVGGVRASHAQVALSDAERAAANRLIDAALADTVGYQRLGALTDTFGHRLSGSASLEHAIDWVLDQMKHDGLAHVRGEPVMVPHWVRGTESATLVSPREVPLHMLGLGMSVGTPPQGITAPVLVVSSFEELQRRAAEAKGKIVLFDHPFPTDVAPMAGYDQAVAYRGGAPVAAAKVGAVAALIRSIESFSIQSPHTGSTRYDPSVPKIPAAALSIEDAELLHRMQDRGQKIVVTLKMDAETLPDAPSRNVVAELEGSEKPDEVVVLGGHIDSWDVGEGAMDDGGCSVAAWEAVHLMQQLGLRPKRTVRVVLWTNEENGGRGGRGYRDAHAAELANHQVAMECDNGVFRPDGVRFQGSAAGLAFIQPVAQLLERIGAGKAFAGDPEADVTPIIQRGVPGLALDVDDTRYFWYHHSWGDMMTMIDRDDFRRCIATMAVWAYALADLDQRVPR
ncbi:MAG TPA: M20/M25/M40 family metallo-hydrolase [Gemmatimonadaceae bacterium]|nr:M20/M25/M40 family metallo-hydrolase [Gemmatimonadaceae bacterium]